MSRTKHPPRPRYRFCWECSRQLQGNAHRIVSLVGGNGLTAIVHAACAEQMEREGRVAEILIPDVKP